MSLSIRMKLLILNKTKKIDETGRLVIRIKIQNEEFKLGFEFQIN